MNENLNLIEILKDCPKGTKLYTTIYGDVEFESINEDKSHPIIVRIDDDHTECFSIDGKIYSFYYGECTLFPSREERDWSKFKPKKPKQAKFDPKTLQPFDRVLVRDSAQHWCCDLFSHIVKKEATYPYLCVGSAFEYCIPYNEDTKHLVGTTEEAPEYYRYWED